MSLQKIKKTTYIALTLLLVCTVMLGAVSYAWLSLSRAPEISGIETNIGSNGSLEIALLTESTFIDPTTIKTKVGSSLEEQDAVISNLSWGNVIDLDDSAYGLGSIALVPARLDVTDALVVNNGLLKVPGYGADGRFTEFSNDTASGIYSVDQFGVGSFSFSTAGQGYGVRGIGKLAGVSAQESALATSRTAVRAYGNAAESDILTIWEENGPGLLEIMHYLYGGKQGELDFQQALLLMRDTAQRLLVIYDYLDSALRQGIIGYASLMVGDAEEFKMIKQNLENKQIPLTVLLDMIPLTGPFHYEATARVIEDDVADLNRLIAACDEGFDRSLLPSMFGILVETDDAYINDTQVRNWQASGVELTEDNILTLYAGHHGNGGYVYGTLHRVVQFVGEYHAFFQYDGVSVEVTTVLDPTLSPVIDTVYGILEQTDDSNDEDYIEVTPLDDVCGFAVDMAFRCNQDSDLLLQTMPEVRIEGDEYPELNNTQGGGSFMRFQSEELTTEQMVHLVDALRIGFMDNQNKLIAVAKLNTSNYQETEDGVTAPLYLYDFTAYADGRIEIGERRSENSAVTSLSQDKEKVISVVVWLDGDYIDNSHASIVNNSMTGTLNLQFSSSADLKPMGSEEPESIVPETFDEYYVEVKNNNEFAFYAFGDGDTYRTFEMDFEGEIDEENRTITVNSITPEKYIAIQAQIPSQVVDRNTGITYSVQIRYNTVFMHFPTGKLTSVQFVSLNDTKVGIVGYDGYNMFMLSKNKDIIYFDGTGLDTSGVTSLWRTFEKCSNLIEVNLSGWDTSSVTDMSEMFYDCEKLETVNFTGWDTSSVTDMSMMFEDCSSLTTVDVSDWDTSSVTSTAGMFFGCTNLTSLDVSGWDTSSVVHMGDMFAHCGRLSYVNVSNWNTFSVQSMDSMFAGCSGLTNIDVRKWNTSSVTDMGDMFGGCIKLEELDLSNWDTSSVLDMHWMFSDCTKLETIYVGPGWVTTQASTEYMFSDCPAEVVYVD